MIIIILLTSIMIIIDRTMIVMIPIIIRLLIRHNTLQ